jgi:hypothetical protein
MIWIGFDPREAAAFAVARETVWRNVPRHWPIHGLVLADLQAAGLYTRPIEWRPSAADRPIMWDVISNAPMSTEHANARFLVPHLAHHGWALFTDGDTLVRGQTGKLGRLFETFDPGLAVYCVKHRHEPPPGLKMDGQEQTRYARKNWTSFIAFNCDHPANKALTLEMVNTLPGRDLHRLCWLDDDLIGEIGPQWNWLVGHSDPGIDPDMVHFTDGVPDMIGYENAPFADEWRAARNDWARGGNRALPHFMQRTAT